LAQPPNKETDAGEFAIEEGYAMPENLFSRIIKTIQPPDIDTFHKAVKNLNQHDHNTQHAETEISSNIMST